jgi:hypothetical protein
MKNPSGSRLLIVGLSYIFTGRDRKIIPPLQEGLLGVDNRRFLNHNSNIVP